MTNIVRTETGEKFTLFYTIRSPFSNFCPCQFTICEDLGNGNAQERWYYSTEQYYMYHKALSAGDLEMAEQIAGERDARKIKMMSRNIKNFVRETWNEISADVMRRGNIAKYTQNPDLRQKLFYTHGSTLVECSPTDVEWGIGLDIFDPNAVVPSKWRGKNKLGHILTEIREELWLKPEYAKEVLDILSMLENFDIFSRQFFAPPKPRIQQSNRLVLGTNDAEFDKRRSLPSPLETDRINNANENRRSLPSYPRTDRYENNGLEPRNSCSIKDENGVSLSHRESHSRSHSRNRKRRCHNLPKDHSQYHSSSDDNTKSHERSDSRTHTRRAAVSSSSSRSRHDVRSGRSRRRNSSESDRESSRSSRKQRKVDGGSAGKKHTAKSRHSNNHAMSSSSDDESSSSEDEKLGETKKPFADTFKSLLERLRNKQCDLWKKNAENCNGDKNGNLSVDD